MKKIVSIGSLFMLALFVSSPAISQTTNSAKQTVTFAVSRPIKPVLNVLANFQNVSTSSKLLEMTALQTQLKQQSTKVTVSASNSIPSDIHLDLFSALETKKSLASDITPRVITITE